MSKTTSTYPLRLPASVKAEIEAISKTDGTSMNQFIATAVAEKVSAMRTAAFFAERKGMADIDHALNTLTRSGGEKPDVQDKLDA